MSETIFTPNADQAPVTVAPVSQPSIDTVPPELVEIVGAGKKYATVDAALKALPHAQTHISKLEEELAQLRDEVTKRKTTQELLDEIKSGIPQGTTTPNEGFNQDTVVKLVERVISQKEQQQAASTNISKVVSVFTEKFADKAEAEYQRIAAEAGLTVQALNQLAATSPTAVIKLAGLVAPTVATPGKTKSDVNTTAFNPQGNSELSAMVRGTSTKDVLAAWRNAGEKVKRSLGE